MIGRYWFVVHFSQHIDCSSTNILLTRRTFQSKANHPLTNRSGSPQVNKFEQVPGAEVRGVSMWTSLNRSGESWSKQFWTGLRGGEEGSRETYHITWGSPCGQTDRQTKHYFPANYSVPVQDLVKGGPASEAESCWHSRAELCEQNFMTWVVKNR